MNDVRMLSIEMTIPVGNLIFFKLFSNSEMPDDRVVLFLLSGAGDRFTPRIGHINLSGHQLATDATLHCVPWHKSRRWAPPTCYTKKKSALARV